MTAQPLTFGSLFAGIGGLDLGFERAGLWCVWQVEIDPFARAVLAKHWPSVRRHDDVRTFPPTEGDWRVDVIGGGFPCQDISVAGRGAGIDGERSGLWSEYARIVRVLRPRYVVVENVSALLARGLDRVLGDLAASGYDAEWDCIPAAAVGAPHIRDRLFVVGSRNCSDADSLGVRVQGHGATEAATSGNERASRQRQRVRADAATVDGTLPDADGERREEQYAPALAARAGLAGRLFAERPGHADHWRVEPNLGRVADGITNRLDRLRTLGNAIVPQVAEYIGRRLILAHSIQEERPC